MLPRCFGGRPDVGTALGARGLRDLVRYADAVRCLGRVPARAVRLWARDLPQEAWWETPLRQERFAVHRQTSSVVLLWTAHESWPAIEVVRGPRLGEVEDALQPLLEAIMDRLGGDLRAANLLVARLPAGGRIPLHRDTAPFFAHAHRVHVPLATHPDVSFVVDGQRWPMEASHLYAIDNLRPHGVSNPGPRARVHLIADLLPASALSP